MSNIIEINNLSFKYNEKKIFDNFNLSIKKGSFNTIIGNNGCGKSTLIKIILGLVIAQGEITINDLTLNQDNLKKIISKIGVVFENPDDQFVAETVMDDIAFSLENMEYSSNEIKERIDKIAKYLNIEDILEREPHTLSGGQKQMVSLASSLVIEPTILILDEAFTMIDLDTKEKIYKILKEQNKKNKITIINVTHDMDDILYGNNIILMDDGKIIENGKNEVVLENEKLFTKLGLKLPFIVDLSIKLKYYGLIDKLIFDMDEMVNILWK